MASRNCSDPSTAVQGDIVPFSAEEGKSWIKDRALALEPASLLDIGPGAGTYGRLLSFIPKRRAIEIFEPYWETYKLSDIYDYVLIADARKQRFPESSIIVFGDVGEHMPKADFIDVWNRARKAATQAVFLSIPIYGYEQGELEGNSHEAHVAQWNHDEIMSTLPGITDYWLGQIVGVYQAVPE